MMTLIMQSSLLESCVYYICFKDVLSYTCSIHLGGDNLSHNLSLLAEVCWYLEIFLKLRRFDLFSLSQQVILKCVRNTYLFTKIDTRVLMHNNNLMNELLRRKKDSKQAMQRMIVSATKPCWGTHCQPEETMFDKMKAWQSLIISSLF